MRAVRDIPSFVNTYEGALTLHLPPGSCRGQSTFPQLFQFCGERSRPARKSATLLLRATPATIFRYCFWLLERRSTMFIGRRHSDWNFATGPGSVYPRTFCISNSHLFGCFKEILH